MAIGNFTNLSALANKWANRLAPVFLLLMVLWLCWSLARIFWLIMAPPQAPTLPELSRQMTIHKQSNTQANFNFFASPVTKTVNNPNTENKAPANIVLNGVMTAIPTSNSSALLSVNGTIKNYRINQQLEDADYTLVDVQWNEVTLENGSGQTTIVTMNESMDLNQEFIAKNGKSNSRRPSTSKSLGQSQTRNIPSANVKNRSSVNDRDDEDLNEDMANGNNTLASTKDSANKEIDKAVSELKKNPSGYLSQMGVMSTGEGYQVTDAMPAKIRRRIGLQSGDKVISVNGQKVGSNPTGDADLLTKIRKSGQAQIQVKRGQQIITIRQQF